MDWTTIIVAIITAIPTIITVVVKAKQTDNKVEKLHSSNEQSQIRSEILQLVMEDKLSVMEGKLPTNYKDIMNLYDYYESQHWNTYTKRKVNEYEQWYLGLTEKKER